MTSYIGYQDGLLALEQSPIQVVTGPGADY